MAVEQECPSCRRRLSISKKVCRCGLKLDKKGGKVYWVSVYVDGEKVRERIGPNKKAAKKREADILSERTEGK